jgi:hypothetical protein
MRYLVLVYALVTFSAATFAQAPDLPHVTLDFCPGEGCVYRDWRALRRVIAWESSERVKQAFVVEPGEIVRALTGDVWTTTPGLAKYRNDQEPVYLLVPEGEGLFRAWMRGSAATVDIAEFKQPDIPGAGYSGCVRNDTCVGEVLSYPKNPWWVQIRNSKGQIGWTDQTRDLDCKNAISSCRDDLEPSRNRP